MHKLICFKTELYFCSVVPQTCHTHITAILLSPERAGQPIGQHNTTPT